MKNYNYYHKRRLERDRINRAERISEKKEGRLPGRRLGFILRLMKEKGINYSGLSKLMKTTKQNLHHYFEVDDDMKLTKATEICHLLGYQLSFSIRWQGNVQPRNLESSAFPKIVKDAATDPNYRLHELAVFLINHEFSVVTFARRTGLDRGMIYRPFAPNCDDTLISNLLTIVSAMGCTVTWVLTKISGRGPSVIEVPAIKKR